MLPCQCRVARRERHTVLELVAEPICSTRLIKAGTSPDTTSDRLIEEPAVQHDVHRPIGRLDLHCPEYVLPVVANVIQHSVEIGLAIVRYQPCCLARAGGITEKYENLDGFAGGHLDDRLERATRIETRTNGAGEVRTMGQSRRVGEAAVAPDELPAIRRPIQLTPPHVKESDT